MAVICKIEQISLNHVVYVMLHSMAVDVYQYFINTLVNGFLANV